MPKKSEQPQAPSFEEALKRLEQTVQVMEAGGLTLEEATRLYEEGMQLAALCAQRLENAELKIRQVQAAFANSQAKPPTEDTEDEESS